MSLNCPAARDLTSVDPENRRSHILAAAVHAEQSDQVVDIQSAQFPARSLAQRPVRQRPLALLQSLDPRVDRVLHDQASDVDLLDLANSVTSINGLILCTPLANANHTLG